MLYSVLSDLEREKAFLKWLMYHKVNLEMTVNDQEPLHCKKTNRRLREDNVISQQNWK